MDRPRQQSTKCAGPIGAAITGALVALILAYVGAYVLTHYGLGVISGPKEALGRAVFSRAALNLYAAQHITLFGSASSANTGPMSAVITLPLTVWAAVPVLAILIGGFVSSAMRKPAGRWGMLIPAIAGGVLYALLLALGSRIVSARIDSFIMPEIGGFGSNPPPMPFKPSLHSTLIFGGAFGVIFSYIGALLAVRGVERQASPGLWWACGKGAIAAALILQILIAGAVAYYVGRPSKDSGASDTQRIFEMLPSAAGMSYALIHGSTLDGSVESRILKSAPDRPFHARVSLYRGTTRNDQFAKSTKPMPPAGIAVGVLLGALAAVLAGRLAVAWGSREGSSLTAIRVAAVHTAYLAALMKLCNIELVQTSPVAGSSILISVMPGCALYYSFFAVLGLSMIGAQLGNRKYRSRGAQATTR